MTRARLRAVLAVACSAGLFGASIASAAHQSGPSNPPLPGTRAAAVAGRNADAVVRRHADPIGTGLAGNRAEARTKTRRKARTKAGAKAEANATAAAGSAAKAQTRTAKEAAAEAAAERRRKQARQAASRSAHRCTPPKTVAGLSRMQTHNARMIVRAGNHLHIGRRGKIIALSTALQESGLRNYANANVPASMRLRHEAVGYDHDSVGLFQQRPLPPWGAGSWGTVRELMTPQIAATKFYRALKGIGGWRRLPVTVAAQQVQVSAYPDAYADNEPQAAAITDALRCP